MNPSEFREAVAKGLGRAILALRDGQIQPSETLMRMLILRWQGWDSLCESNRGVYCADLIEASAWSNDLTSCLYALLGKNKGYRAHSHQRMRTAVNLFRRGDERAKAALYAA